MTDPDCTPPAPAQADHAAPPAAAPAPNPCTGPAVDAAARNRALRTLFHTDPHFKQGDDLDVCVDAIAALEHSPHARRQTILRARALGLLDDELVDQIEPDGRV